MHSLGVHGGLQQTWCNPFDEAIRGPLLVSGPGIVPRSQGISTPTSDVDLIPALLGLAGIDADGPAAVIRASHSEVHPLAGCDLSGLLTAQATEAELVKPAYFMTDDDVSRGFDHLNLYDQ